MSDPTAPNPEPSPEPSPSGRHRLMRVARVVYLVGLAGLLAYLVFTRRHQLADLVAGTRPGWLLLAFVLSLGQLLPSVAVWTVALRRLGSTRIPMREVALATAQSVPTRYLPGSVWYALGRATWLRRRHDASISELGATAALESILTLVVAIALGSALLLGAGRLPTHRWWIAGWFVALSVVGSPPVVNAAAGWLSRRRGRTLPVQLDWTSWAMLVGLTLVHWVWSATTFTVYLHAFPRLTTIPVLEVAGSFLVAWAVGFLALFAPQGAGVFETTVAAMLVSSGTASVAVVAGGYRAMVVVRDAVVFLGSWIMRRREESDQSTHSTGA